MGVKWFVIVDLLMIQVRRYTEWQSMPYKENHNMMNFK